MLKLDKLIADFYKEQAKSSINAKVFKKGDFNYITIDGTSLYRYRRFMYDINAGESNICDMIPEEADKAKEVTIAGIEVLPDGAQLYRFVDMFGNDISYCNKKLLDRYVNIKDERFFILNNLDNKNPIAIGPSYNRLIGIILPVKRR